MQRGTTHHDGGPGVREQDGALENIELGQVGGDGGQFRVAVGGALET